MMQVHASILRGNRHVGHALCDLIDAIVMKFCDLRRQEDLVNSVSEGKE